MHRENAVLDLAELRGPPLPENEWWESESDAELADLVLVAQPSDTSAPRHEDEDNDSGEYDEPCAPVLPPSRWTDKLTFWVIIVVGVSMAILKKSVDYAIVF
ncbi:uncharacterized protein CTHT_0060830 [Thermochaetoides thermophila DSM 1495]|uniref:Uncharacterized protein n=1 Tax=Chaetomium thermophilum (strain DSM 1495 / CBS 144.50 / IMI 039719) TaxID=759272 RepID=G0SF52_CHATD|nr:hypothetical protein CTHT_0060830 [Thermochaetoides thermophila DSM 1495]EGS18068.1 hypothetical protein CTHT_0060830 [Thermochaetoides thermophila DSM 1495]